jgi:hypothetical protein
MDGQIGWLEETSQGLMVRLDRPAQARQVVPYQAQEWLPAKQERFTSMQVARICYALDREVRIVRGEYGLAEFGSMKDQARQKLLNGPGNPDVLRRQLYDLVKAALEAA